MSADARNRSSQSSCAALAPARPERHRLIYPPARHTAVRFRALARTEPFAVATAAILETWIFDELADKQLVEQVAIVLLNADER